MKPFNNWRYLPRHLYCTRTCFMPWSRRSFEGKFILAHESIKEHFSWSKSSASDEIFSPVSGHLLPEWQTSLRYLYDDKLICCPVLHFGSSATSATEPLPFKLINSVFISTEYVTVFSSTEKKMLKRACGVRRFIRNNIILVNMHAACII